MSISRRGFLGLCTKAVAAAALVPLAFRKTPAPGFMLEQSERKLYPYRCFEQQRNLEFVTELRDRQYNDVIPFDQMRAAGSRDLRSSKVAQWWADEMDRITFEAMSGKIT